MITPRLAFLAPALAFAVPFSAAEAAPLVDRFERQIVKTIGYQYLLSLPTGYETRTDTSWPLLVFLHGSGERGDDPWLVARHGPPRLLGGAPATTTAAPAAAAESAEASANRAASTRALKENFIVVSPQCPAGQSWDDETILALIDEVSARYRVDPRRVYLTGLSLGGYGTWSTGLKHAARFAAIAPICGGGQPVDIRRGARTDREALLRLGVWAFHGANDNTVPVQESVVLFNELKRAGVRDVRLTVYPTAGHDSWTETYDNPELYRWLLSHELPPAARP